MPESHNDEIIRHLRDRAAELEHEAGVLADTNVHPSKEIAAQIAGCRTRAQRLHAMAAAHGFVERKTWRDEDHNPYEYVLGPDGRFADGE